MNERKYPEDQLRAVLESGYNFCNQPGFIPDDPISIPHRFTRKADIELAGFLTSTLAWGRRRTIIDSASRLLASMGNEPAGFLLDASPRDFKPFLGFVHRTFNGDDCIFFLTALQRIFREHGSLEPLFTTINTRGATHAIIQFRTSFLQTDHLPRSEKHLANPQTGSACKRINMFLRWMVRRDSRGVDFGLWKTIDPSALVCPLDLHSGRTARNLGLLSRRQNDWKAALELTDALRRFDPADPVRFDFALFGMGIGMDGMTG